MCWRCCAPPGGRSIYIYAPIYAVTSGLGEVAGEAIVSGGTAMLFFVPFWGWMGRRHGLRRLLVAGHAASSVIIIAFAFATGIPWFGTALLLCATSAMGSVHGAGNVPFLRAVHPHERPEMTTVFATYRDAAQLLPPGVFSVLLKLFELPEMFVAGGLVLRPLPPPSAMTER